MGRGGKGGLSLAAASIWSPPLIEKTELALRRGGKRGEGVRDSGSGVHHAIIWCVCVCVCVFVCVCVCVCVYVHMRVSIYAHPINIKAINVTNQKIRD